MSRPHTPAEVVDCIQKRQAHLADARTRLAGESSPYLLLHSENPVDWYPWGEEAFARAREEDKPIFLSVGYSTCYWCHVMERECFSNPEIARQMNEGFVSIKLDREERPDLDEVYMAATQLITRSGGWPNSLFLTHALNPFFSGKYFPPVDGIGVPGEERHRKSTRLNSSHPIISHAVFCLKEKNQNRTRLHACYK